jgi:hypothetical protein
MKINAKKKELANPPVGPFTTFSHCVYGFNVRSELIFSRRDAKGAEVLEYQYDDIGDVNAITPNSSTPSLISKSYDRMGRRVKTEGTLPTNYNTTRIPCLIVCFYIVVRQSLGS